MVFSSYAERGKKIILYAAKNGRAIAIAVF
jgi:hypothetical protein